MSLHQHDNNAKALWNYFQKVIKWVESTFITKQPFMKGLPWGFYYNKFKNKNLNSKKIDKAISDLIQFEDKIKLSGIYEYILTEKPKFLSPRKFPDNIKFRVYEKQNHLCNICKENFDISEMEADHKIAWFDNGETTEDNCQMLCRPHHYEKTKEQTKILRSKFKF